ncbi:MAG: SufD family Fe-S cluster assembly protein [Legionellales bacterium]|nr:SufD family Fe-S cluster assembly protein [Legionellales bacterium]
MSLNVDYFKKFYEYGAKGSSSDLKEIRAKFYNRFLAEGLPNRKSESWRYARIDGWFKNTYACPSVERGLFDFHDESFMNEVDILVCDGVVNIVNTELDIVVMDLKQALQTYPEKVMSHLTKSYNYNNTGNPFADLAAAAWSSGVFVDVPPGYTLIKPLKIVHVFTSEVFLNSYNIFNLGLGAKATIVEYFAGNEGINYAHNFATSINLETGAVLTNEKLQNSAPGAVVQDYRMIAQQNSSEYKQRQYSFGAKVARDETLVNFVGDNAKNSFSGLSFALPDSWHSSHVKVLHNANNCHSDQKFRSLVSNRAESSFLGHIFVPKAIAATLAYQDSKSLLLGALSRSNVKPYLEIFADDVVCTHSASVGQVDKSSLFYLRARGMTESEAYFILLSSFASELIKDCQSDFLRLKAAEKVKELSNMIFAEGGV